MLGDDFWRRVSKTEDCWLWTGSQTKAGYGQVVVKGKKVYVHRLAYAELVGPLTVEEKVCHTCDTPNCLRPEHLFKGSQGDNMRDAAGKGRSRNQNTDKTHCKRGHPLSGENLGYDHRGDRFCKACQRLLNQSYRQSHLKGRRRAFCKRGHALEGANLITRQRFLNGHWLEVRECRACHYARDKEARRERSQDGN